MIKYLIHPNTHCTHVISSTNAINFHLENRPKGINKRSYNIIINKVINNKLFSNEKKEKN